MLVDGSIGMVSLVVPASVYAKVCPMNPLIALPQWYRRICGVLELLILLHAKLRSSEMPRFAL